MITSAVRVQFVLDADVLRFHEQYEEILRRIAVWRPLQDSCHMSQPRRMKFVNDNCRRDSMTASVGWYSIWQFRTRLRFKVYDRKSTTRPQCGENAPIHLFRSSEMMVDIPHEDGVVRIAFMKAM